MTIGRTIEPTHIAARPEQLRSPAAGHKASSTAGIKMTLRPEIEAQLALPDRSALSRS